MAAEKTRLGLGAKDARPYKAARSRYDSVRLRLWGTYAAATGPNDAMNIARVERIVFAMGLALLTFWGVARLHRTLASRGAIAGFKREVASMPAAGGMSPTTDPILRSKVDFKLWSTNRIAAYEASLLQKKAQPLAILRVPRINLEVPVFDDTDELTLNRGVGRIRGTKQIGQFGNIGIAGHRDGFFRGLKDIALGDIVELEEAGGTKQYVIKQIQIVRPEDTSVLSPTSTATLTLVTCFPFYYVGSAPQRYIVTAVIQDSSQREQGQAGSRVPTARISQTRRRKHDLN
jgi:sortase A